MSDRKQSLRKNLKTQNAKRKSWLILGIVLALLVLAFLAYQIPHVRAVVNTVYTRIYYKIKPPSAAVFNPSQQGTIEAIIRQTQTAAAALETDESVATPVVSVENTDVPPTPTQTPIPVPSAYTIEGMSIEAQTFNNCGPANLSMNLNFWNHQTNQAEMRQALRTHDLDRNVMLSEMRDYVQANTSLKAVLRYGGELDLLKRLVSGGYPVLLERGHTDPDDGWMGHYSIIHAYDDATQSVSSNDTLLGKITVSYTDLEIEWRQFDGIFIVVYPPENEVDVMARLGDAADFDGNLRLSLAAVEARIPNETGRELFFALYSRGQLLVEMQDYVTAAQAFDQAFGVYAGLDTGPYGRPWRVLWYQIGPYLAYYNSGRYEDTLNLALQTVGNSREPSLPETWYWAGMAAAKLEKYDFAEIYFNKALEFHPNWQIALDGLATLP